MILTRSPFYVNVAVDGATITDVTLELTVWQGDQITDEPVSPSYSITKKVPTVETENIQFNISNEIRDFYDLNPPTLSSQGVQSSNDGNVLWVRYKVTDSELTVLANEVTFALDGYGYFTQGVNPQIPSNLLQSHEEFLIPDQTGAFVVIPFINDGSITSIQVESFPSGNIFETFPITSTTQSADRLQYLVIETLNLTNETSLVVDFGATSLTYQIDVECKFSPKTVVFLNKNGAFESMVFFKKNIENIERASQRFKNNVVLNGSYDVYKHQYKTFDVETRESITMNTGFIPESANEAIQQLMASELVFLVNDIDYQPINVESGSLQYKTRVNDKLINYELSFKYAFDKINNI